LPITSDLTEELEPLTDSALLTPSNEEVQFAAITLIVNSETTKQRTSFFISFPLWIDSLILP